jgi:hypothetical protein
MATQTPDDAPVMFWLQPGGQRVGDQLFNPFSYSEMKSTYVTSLPNSARTETSAKFRPRRITSPDAAFAFAVTSCTLGFGCQFVGFRGVHASIALFQLAITLVMAIIRALLRTRRLHHDGNHLEALGRTVEGHELDWQALMLESLVEKTKIPNNSSSLISLVLKRLHFKWPLSYRTGANNKTELESTDDVHRSPERNLTNLHNVADRSHESSPKKGWFIVDYCPPLEAPTHQQQGSSANVDSEGSGQLFKGRQIVAFATPPETSISNSNDPNALAAQYANKAIKWAKDNEEVEESPNEAARIMHYRTRLAHLTDDHEISEEKWEDKVRAVADKLQDAIQDTAEYVFANMRLSESSGNEQSLVWSTTCQLEDPSTATSSATILPIHFVMSRKDSRWIANKNQLEAVLGLWSWSLKSTTIKVEGKKSFMLSTKSKKDQVEPLLHLWIPRTQDIKPKDIQMPKHILSTFDLLPSSHQELTSTSVPSEKPNFSGGSNYPTTLSASLRSLIRPDSEQALLFWISTESSLLQLLAQDIFTIFMTRIADLLEPLRGVEPRSATSGSAEPTSSDQPYHGITNPHIRRIADIFAASGIGSAEDALASIVPPLLQRSKLPRLDESTKSLLSIAKSLRRSGRYKQGASLLRSLIRHGLPELREEALKSLCELYRKAPWPKGPQLTLQSIIQAREESISENKSSLDPQSSLESLREVLKPYQELWNDPQNDHRIRNDPITQYTRLTEDQLDKIIKQKAMPRGLRLINELDFGKEKQEDILKILKWAIKQRCPPLIEDLWTDPRTIVNLSDNELETPLLWALEDKDCDTETLESLLDWPNVNPNLPDRRGRTPLMAASEKGREDFVMLLLGKGADVRAKDNKGSTALVFAVENKYEEVSKRLLTAGADVDVSSSEYGTVLHAAVRWSVDILALILDRNVDKEAKGRKGPDTALFRGRIGGRRRRE